MILQVFIMQEVLLLRPSSKYTLDRFEGDTSVLLLRENEEIVVHVPTVQLPAGTQKGDILDIQFNDKVEMVTVRFLKDETEQAKMKVKSLLNKLLEKNTE